MKRIHVASLTGWLLAAGLTFAQPGATPGNVHAPVQPCSSCIVPNDPEDYYWGSVDYLLWFVSKSPMPTPLVTRGEPGIPGAPGVSVLYGGNSVDYGAFSGARFGLGTWIDPDRVWGIDASGFFLFQENNQFTAGSNSAGDPALFQPVIIPGIGPQSYYTSLPGVASGSISTELTFRFYGWEVNAVRNLVRNNGLQVDTLLGYRSLRLSEQLLVTSRIRTLIDGAVDFLGAPTPAGSFLLTGDSFGTSSDVYAPQIGGHVNYTVDRFSFDLTTKVGLGCVCEKVSIHGSTTLLPPVNSNLPSQSALGGILATSTNVPGARTTRFVVVPEVAGRFSMNVTEMVRLSVGYSFLYVSDVIRPGRQIDPVVNPNNVPTDQDFGNFAGPARPELQVRHSSFWAHGVNFGVEIRY